jgi:hypothetical protein
MGSGKLAEALLWLFVMNLGIAFGAGLYEGRIVVPQWITSSPDTGAHWHPEEVRKDNTGLRFWAFVTTGPLTLLTIANGIAAWSASGRLRRFWVGAAAAALVERAFTLAYFIPTLVGLMDSPDSPQAAALAMRWVNLNYVRHVIALIAWVAALKAFAVLYQTEERAVRGSRHGSLCSALTRCEARPRGRGAPRAARDRGRTPRRPTPTP